jgi:hypothetical protein
VRQVALAVQEMPMVAMVALQVEEAVAKVMVQPLAQVEMRLWAEEVVVVLIQVHTKPSTFGPLVEVVVEAVIPLFLVLEVAVVLVYTKYLPLEI